MGAHWAAPKPRRIVELVRVVHPARLRGQVRLTMTSKAVNCAVSKAVRCGRATSQRSQCLCRVPYNPASTLPRGGMFVMPRDQPKVAL